MRPVDILQHHGDAVKMVHYLQQENERLREALEAISKGRWTDTDGRWIETLEASIARTALANEQTPRPTEEKK